MDSDLFKTGSCSIILGKNLYKNYFPVKENKLLKITKILKNHNEFSNLKNIRKIENYEKYFTIPDEESALLQPSDTFYKFLQDMCKHESIRIFKGNLHCFYIDSAGDKELLDTICDIEIRKDFNIWKSYKKILEFTKQIMTGVTYLHKIKICHLDLKPENIIVNTLKFEFKIDEDLIGGFKLQLGSIMIDTSIKNKLKKYQQTMLES